MSAETERRDLHGPAAVGAWSSVQIAAGASAFPFESPGGPDLAFELLRLLPADPPGTGTRATGVGDYRHDAWRASLWRSVG